MTNSRLMVAPTGARRTKDDHPALPIAPAEVAATAAACFEAGADTIHLHVRDDEGLHSLDAARYRESMEAVAWAAPDMAVQITTEAAGRFSPADQLACIEAVRPAWASAAARELAPEPEVARDFYAFAAEAGVRLQHILHEPQDLELMARLADEGILPPDGWEVICVLGRYVPPREAAPEELAAFRALMDHRVTHWSVCAFGKREVECLAAAAAEGGGLRVGLENNIQRPDGTPLDDNTESVRRVRDLLDG